MACDNDEGGGDPIDAAEGDDGDAATADAPVGDGDPGATDAPATLPDGAGPPADAGAMCGATQCNSTQVCCLGLGGPMCVAAGTCDAGL